jgi:hypothetical protein
MSDPKVDLLSSFHAFRDALKACDTEALDALLTSDYRSYNLRGELEGRDGGKPSSPRRLPWRRARRRNSRFQVLAGCGAVESKKPGR